MRDIAAIAPPLAALQLLKLQRDTMTLLSKADTAPPIVFGLKHFANDITDLVTKEMTVRKAVPVMSKRPLQLKNVHALAAAQHCLRASDGTRRS